MDMKKNIFYFTAIVIVLFFVACNKEDNWLETQRIVSITASMPEKEPSTRVELEQGINNSIILTWEVGDEMQLVFVQGETKKKIPVIVSNISNNGKSAQFNINIPIEIEEGIFDIYGVYGGEGLSDDNPIQVKLPLNAGTASSLSSVQERKDLMLYFASKDIQTTNPHISVSFQHLGSLFSITLENTATTSLSGLSYARLVGVGGDGKWAYNSDNGGGIYNLVSEEFLNTDNSGNYISFKTEENILIGGESITFWG